MKLLALLSLIFVSQASNAALKCDPLKKWLDELNPAKRPWVEIVLSEKQLDKAFAALPAPHALTPKDMEARLRILQAKLEDHFPKYLSDNVANCTMRRSDLRLALVATGLELKGKARVIKAKLRASLQSPNKFPTLISVLADARVLDAAFERRLWIPAPKDGESAKNLLNEVKASIESENKQFKVPWELVVAELAKRPTNKEKADFLRASAEFKLLREHLLAEPAESAIYLKRIRQIANRL